MEILLKVDLTNLADGEKFHQLFGGFGQVNKVYVIKLVDTRKVYQGFGRFSQVTKSYMLILIGDQRRYRSLIVSPLKFFGWVKLGFHC